MSDNEKKTLTPKLRFPEFREEPAWTSKPLGHCLDYLHPTPYLVSSVVYSPSFKTPVLTAGKTFILGHTDEQDGIFSKGLPVIIFDDFTTATQFVDFPFKAKSSAMKILLAKPGANIKFMYEALQTISYVVGAHERHWISTFAPMEVPVPSAPEQQKIADCLTSLDELIAAQGRKVEALKAYKKGLMQQLFPREGETIPRLRFPEFHNAPAWKGHLLGEIVSISKGKGVSKSDIAPDGKTPCIRYAELYTTYGEVISEVKSHTNVPVDGLVFSEAGDVIIPASGETKEDIATCACVVDGGIALGSDLNILRSRIDGRFFSYYLNGCKRPELAKVAQGDTVAHLYPSQISKLQISIPVDKSEQQRIADCLSSLDARIMSESRKLDALKLHKKGLMQLLFPSVEGGS